MSEPSGNETHPVLLGLTLVALVGGVCGALFGLGTSIYIIFIEMSFDLPVYAGLSGLVGGSLLVALSSRTLRVTRYFIFWDRGVGPGDKLIGYWMALVGLYLTVMSVGVIWLIVPILGATSRIDALNVALSDLHHLNPFCHQT